MSLLLLYNYTLINKIKLYMISIKCIFSGPIMSSRIRVAAVVGSVLAVIVVAAVVVIAVISLR